MYDAIPYPHLNTFDEDRIALHYMATFYGFDAAYDLLEKWNTKPVYTRPENPRRVPRDIRRQAA